MNKTKKKTQQLTLVAFFVAIEIIMMMTPIGYIPVGAINITTMHLPVILASILLGPKIGAITGFVFGCTSLIRATMQPGITSFCFSPFITIGGVSGNFGSLLICFAPRITLGILPYYLYRLFSKKMASPLASALSAGINTFLHTLFVMGLIWLFFGEAYASAAGISVGAVIIATLTSNGILEIILASVVIPALCKALMPIVERMNL